MPTALRRSLVVIFVLALGFALPLGAAADHSWGDYHWSRSSLDSELELKLGSNVSSAWPSYLSAASSDWSLSTVLNTAVVKGRTNGSTCQPSSGRIEVCSANYGDVGWLGLAQIWASGSHITQATAKLNDSYFAHATYDTYGWRQLVMCHEIGHTFGLAHRDENFDNMNVGSCLDYTRYPEGGVHGSIDYGPSNTRPDKHDYELLETKYGHADAKGGGRPGGRAAAARLNSPKTWGTLVESSNGGRTQTFIRRFADGTSVVTFVTWADPQ